MLAAVILASGMSERFGQNKLLMPLGEYRIIEHVIQKVKASHIDKTYLVWGHQGEQLKEVAKRYKIEAIHNPDYKLGQSMSVKKAVEALEGQVEGVMFLLGDQPFVSVDTINLLKSTFEKNIHHIIIPTYEGKRGNPVIFSKDFFEDMKNLQGDKGARDIIKEYHHRVIKVPIDCPMENYDIDTKEDYEEAMKYRR